MHREPTYFPIRSLEEMPMGVSMQDKIWMHAEKADPGSGRKRALRDRRTLCGLYSYVTEPTVSMYLSMQPRIRRWSVS